MNKADLRLDWCSYAAAKYAVETWHYSRRMPAGKALKLGVWEGGAFIGALVFGMGSGNATNGTRYGLALSHDMAELERVALRSHRSPVSRIVAVGVRMLRKQSPNIRLLISLADPAAGHYGGIYQAGGWIYTGRTKADVQYYCRGTWMHHRSAGSHGSLVGLPSRPIPAKHRYLLPLDAEMRRRIEPLRQPYPKRAGSETSDTPADQAGKGGSTPTPALHLSGD